MSRSAQDRLTDIQTAIARVYAYRRSRRSRQPPGCSETGVSSRYRSMTKQTCRRRQPRIPRPPSAMTVFGQGAERGDAYLAPQPPPGRGGALTPTNTVSGRLPVATPEASMPAITSRASRPGDGVSPIPRIMNRLPLHVSSADNDFAAVAAPKLGDCFGGHG